MMSTVLKGYLQRWEFSSGLDIRICTLYYTVLKSLALVRWLFCYGRQLRWLYSHRVRAPCCQTLLCCIAWLGRLLTGCSVSGKTTMLTPILQSKGTTPSNFTPLSCLAWVAALCQGGVETTMLTPILQSKGTMLPNYTLLYCLAWVAALCPERQIYWLQSYRAKAPCHQTLLCCLALFGWLLCASIDSTLTEQGHHAVKLYSVVLPGLGGCSVSGKTTMLLPIFQSKCTTLLNLQ